jgi:hypothetical protein
LVSEFRSERLRTLGGSAVPLPGPYRRTTNLGFLETCHPRIAEIYRYWDRKRDDRAMPSRGDIDPSEIKSFLPAIIIVDVVPTEPPNFVYRLVGTREVEARGTDPTGRLVGEEWFGITAEEVLTNYRTVVENRAVLLDTEYRNVLELQMREAGTIFLPLSDDGETVSKILIYTEYVRL